VAPPDQDERGANYEYAGRMAELARALRSQRTSVATLAHVVQATSEMVKNTDDVSITVRHRDGRVETQAWVGELAVQADQLQQLTGEGPCVDTTWDAPMVLACDLPDDGMWPRWAASVSQQLEVRSVLCVRLFTHEDHELGALQLFSTHRDAFDAEAVDEVLGIAAHAAVALGAVMNLESMQFGLVRRTMIGQATGILMERYDLDQHAAFEVLRRTSKDVGRKVFDLAIELVEGRRPAGL
jgi:GAF domain-containing protein